MTGWAVRAAYAQAMLARVARLLSRVVGDLESSALRGSAARGSSTRRPSAEAGRRAGA